LIEFQLDTTSGVATHARWLAIKIGIVGAASIVLTGLLSLMVTWWSSPIQKADMDRLTPQVFGASCIAPIGYAAFAFAALCWPDGGTGRRLAQMPGEELGRRVHLEPRDAGVPAQIGVQRLLLGAEDVEQVQG
jgi:hypothetical protein